MYYDILKDDAGWYFALFGVAEHLITTNDRYKTKNEAMEACADVLADFGVNMMVYK